MAKKILETCNLLAAKKLCFLSLQAVAAVGVASDRACIASNGTMQTLFSEEDVLGCCAICGNCYGGDPLKALVYWVNEGLVSGDRDGCRPYSADLSCGIPCSPAVYPLTEYKRACSRQCQDIYFRYSYENDKHFGNENILSAIDFIAYVHLFRQAILATIFIESFFFSSLYSFPD
ncbi:unnamed protein product [Toxocara canis]|uniref:Pept_C1 domain-containing protein n=1 Tax=Toxocara canis TaxID=6265 RepID=A0A183U770_TOXCA|nr:unnamed protein product [Toxocara canis]